MTIRATNSTPRPMALTGTKAAAPVAETEAPTSTAHDAVRDRLVLSPQATQATEVTADSLNEAELQRIRGTGGTTAPEVAAPEAKQPETKPEVTAPEAKQPETTPEVTTPETKQPETTPETAKVEESKTETAKTEATKTETATQASQAGTTAAQTTQSETTTPEKTDAATSQTRTGEAQKKPETQKKLLTSHVAYYFEKQHFEQIAPLIGTALAGQTVSFKNSYDMNVDVTVTKGANAADGHEQYQLKVGTGSFAVAIAPDQDSKVLLAKVVEYYSRFPEHMRDGLKTINLETKQNPEDAYWVKAFNNSQFASAATAGSGVINFWHLKDNPLNLSEDTFNHEMGHLVGESLKRKGPEFATRVPEGWQDAAKADDDKVSNYAGMNPDEDFAETWSYYLYSRHDDKAMEALRERVPNRVKILDALYEKAEGHPAPPAPPAAPAATAPQKQEGNGNG